MFPLLTVSSQQSREILASRAEQLLGGGAADTASQSDGEEEEISCTPAFGSSSLAGQLLGHPAAVRGGEEEAPINCESDEHRFFASDEEVEDAKDVPEDGSEGVGKGGSKDVNDGGSDGCKGGNESGSEGGNEDNSESGDEDEVKMDHQPSVGHLETVAAHPVDPPKTSFVDEFKGVAYPTLWQLGCGELTVDVVGDYYVPALSSLLSPSKVHAAPEFQNLTTSLNIRKILCCVRNATVRHAL